MIDLTNILYIAFRLAPFILVCFFVLESILNWDLKGIMYLFGLLVTCIVVVMFGNIVEHFNTATPATTTTVTTAAATAAATKLIKCNTFAIGKNGAKLSPKLPLSTTVFSYTFFYLLMFIINSASTHPGGWAAKGARRVDPQTLNDAMQQNVPTLILFPLLIIIDVIWNMMSGCAEIQNIVITIIISAVMGICWALIISATKNVQLQYLSNKNVCSRPSKTLYRCTVKT